jgi:DnaJ-class molecular chaperone
MQKMKRTHYLLVLAVAISLLVLQFSCATVEKKRAEEVPPEKAVEKPAGVEKAPEGKQLLLDTHKAAGKTCKDCHVKPPKEGVSNDVCLTCHADYKIAAASNIDPHNAHMTYDRCGDCHHVHKPSENQCLRCHDFDMQAP